MVLLITRVNSILHFLVFVTLFTEYILQKCFKGVLLCITSNWALFMPRVIGIVLGAPFTFTAICDKIHAIGILHTVQTNLKDVDICIG